MPTSDKDIVWEQRRAGDLKVGDRDKWGYGHQMKNSYRTVSKVERWGNGIVRVWHRETDERFYETYAEDFRVTVAKDVPTGTPGRYPSPKSPKGDDWIGLMGGAPRW